MCVCVWCSLEVLKEAEVPEGNDSLSLTQTGGEDFPGGPGVKTPCFHCRGHGFDPWTGKFLMPHCVAKKKNKNKSMGGVNKGIGSSPIFSSLMDKIFWINT